MSDPEDGWLDEIYASVPDWDDLSPEEQARILAREALRQEDLGRAKQLLEEARDLVGWGARSTAPLLDIMAAAGHLGIQYIVRAIGEDLVDRLDEDLDGARDFFYTDEEEDLQDDENPPRLPRAPLYRLGLLERVLKAYYRAGLVEEAAPLREAWDRLTDSSAWSDPDSIPWAACSYKYDTESELDRLRDAARAGLAAPEIPRPEVLLPAPGNGSVADAGSGEGPAERLRSVPDDDGGAVLLSRVALAAWRHGDAELVFSCTGKLREMLTRRTGAKRSRLLERVADTLLRGRHGILNVSGTGPRSAAIAADPVARRLLEFIATEAAAVPRLSRTRVEDKPIAISLHWLRAGANQVLGRARRAGRLRAHVLRKIAPGIEKAWIEEQLAANPSLDDLVERLRDGFFGPGTLAGEPCVAHDFWSFAAAAENAGLAGLEELARIFADLACRVIDLWPLSMSGFDEYDLRRQRSEYEEAMASILSWASWERVAAFQSALDDVEQVLRQIEG